MKQVRKIFFKTRENYTDLVAAGISILEGTGNTVKRIHEEYPKHFRLALDQLNKTSEGISFEDAFENLRKSFGATLPHWESLTTHQKIGAINKLKGHVSEFKALEILEKLGFDVKIAEKSNEPGYDAFINEEKISFKNYRNFTDIKIADQENINAGFDVPIFMNGDISGIPDHEPIIRINPEASPEEIISLIKTGNYRYFAIDDLSNNKISILVANAMEKMADSVSLPLEKLIPEDLIHEMIDASQNIPFVAITIHTLIEGRAVIKKEKNGAQAVKRISKKAVRSLAKAPFVKVGIAKGAMMGGAAGSVIPGAGTVVGAVVGAGAGAFAANKIGNIVCDNSEKVLSEGISNLKNSKDKVNNHIKKMTDQIKNNSPEVNMN